MDPLAHTLVGATLAETRLRNGTAALAAPAGVLAANAPDIDAITMFISRDLSLGFRRGWTHGVLGDGGAAAGADGGPVAARPGGGAVAGAGPDGAGGAAAAADVGGGAQPPALDWLNTYGVRFLMPFDDTWFYGDALFIIDPWVWLLGGLTVVLASSATWGSAAVWARPRWR